MGDIVFCPLCDGAGKVPVWAAATLTCHKCGQGCAPTVSEMELWLWQRFASYCRSCALSGEDNPQTFEQFKACNLVMGGRGPSLQLRQRVRAIFNPRRTDDLRDAMVRFIHKEIEREVGWLIEEGPYAGEWAMITFRPGEPADMTPPYWIPSGDLAIVELYEQ